MSTCPVCVTGGEAGRRGIGRLQGRKTPHVPLLTPDGPSWCHLFKSFFWASGRADDDRHPPDKYCQQVADRGQTPSWLVNTAILPSLSKLAEHFSRNPVLTDKNILQPPVCPHLGRPWMVVGRNPTAPSEFCCLSPRLNYSCFWENN